MICVIFRFFSQTCRSKSNIFHSWDSFEVLANSRRLLSTFEISSTINRFNLLLERWFYGRGRDTGSRVIPGTRQDIERIYFARRVNTTTIFVVLSWCSTSRPGREESHSVWPPPLLIIPSTLKRIDTLCHSRHTSYTYVQLWTFYGIRTCRRF